MNPRRKQRLLVVSTILIGLMAMVLLVLYALRANIDLFYTPGELRYGKGEDHALPHPGQRLRVGGMVRPGSVKRAPDSLKIEFEIYDRLASVKVKYDGVLPDLFREGQGVVAQGVLGPDNVINAREILAKHDANYTPPEVKAAMDKNHAALPTAPQPVGSAAP